MNINNKLTIDFETRSAADLDNWGAAAYAEHPSTEVICLAVKKHGQEPVIWFSPDFRFPGCPDWAALPTIDDDTLRQMIAEAEIIEAHNMEFEFNIWKYTMPRYGFTVMLPLTKLRCSAAKAASCGFPRNLEDACNVLGVAQRKDTEGATLMKTLCSPRVPTLDEQIADPDWRKHYFWNGTPEDFAREGLYCMQDIRAEEALSDALPDLSPVEQRIWLKSLIINDRGICIDSRSVEALTVCTDVERSFLSDEFEKITGINSPTRDNALIEYLKQKGVTLKSVSKDAVSDLLKSDLAPDVRRALEIPLTCAKLSTKRLPRMLASRNNDGRVRGAFVYHGAATGRWASQRLQFHNLPKSGEDKQVDACLIAFNRGDLELIRHDYGDVITAAASCLRAMLVPATGKEFICADFSNVEGRVREWLAGDEVALDVYREGRDPYIVNAAQIYDVDYDAVTKEQRQVGKVAELELGYQCGIETYQEKCAEYAVVLSHKEAERIINQWRQTHSMTMDLWYELDRCAKKALKNPGGIFVYGRIAFMYDGYLLQMRIPSGRTLCYRSPEIDPMKINGRQREEIWYRNNKGNRDKLYGGKLTENLTQAVARDLLANAIFNVEARGYLVVLHVHDELVTEVPEGFGSVEELCDLMCQLPPWADGLPMNAEGWRGKRYRK